MTTKAKLNQLLKIKTELEEKFGEDTVMGAAAIPVRPKFSSGSMALDFAVNGGLPSDRVVEIFGREGTGKTTLAILSMIQFLDAQPDRAALILDLEHKITPDWLKLLVGSDRMQRIVYTQPDHAEEATNIYKKALRSGQFCFALFDSIGGAPSARRNDDAEVANVGGNSIAISEFARTAQTLSAKYNCLTVGINQVREDMAGYHRPITPGGTPWKHACLIRIMLSKGKGIVEHEVGGEKIPIGRMVVAKVYKNQQGPEGRTCWWWFFNVATPEYGFGVDVIDEIVRLGKLTGVFERKGSWYHHPMLPQDKAGDHKIQSEAKLIEWVKANPDTHPQLREEVMARIAEVADEVAPISDPDAPVTEPTGIQKILLDSIEKS